MATRILLLFTFLLLLASAGCTVTREVPISGKRSFTGQDEFKIPFPVRVESGIDSYAFDRSASFIRIQDERYIEGVAYSQHYRETDYRLLPLKEVSKIWIGEKISVETKDRDWYEFEKELSYFEVKGSKLVALHGIEKSEGGESVTVPVAELSWLHYEGLDFTVPGVAFGSVIFASALLLYLLN